jgi:hypothetical protein
MQDPKQVDMGERYRNWMNALFWQVIIAIMVGKEIAGEAYLEKLEKAFYDYGVRCAGYWKDISDLKEEKPDCLALGKIMDTVDDSFANWWDGYVEKSSKAFEKHINNCPVATTLKWAPEICERMVPAALNGILQTLNPKATIAFDSFMSKGDKTCHYRMEVKE